MTSNCTQASKRVEEALRRVKGLKTPEKVASPKKSQNSSPVAKASSSKLKDAAKTGKPVGKPEGQGKGPSAPKGRKRKGGEEAERPGPSMTSEAVAEGEMDKDRVEPSLIARR
jgi:hypothetical protein